MDFIDKLLEFVTTPLGFIFLCSGLLFASKATQKQPLLGWLLLAIFGFAASLGKFADEFILEPPALAFPLQQIRETGRPLAIVLLLLLMFIASRTQNYWRRKIIPQPIIYIALVQGIIFFKLLIYGNLTFALLTAITVGGLISMVILGPSRWLQDDKNFYLGVWAIAMVGVIFSVVNIYQAVLDKYAITFVHGWFLGTTGNPHHAAVLLVASIPCFLFLFLEEGKNISLKWIWMVFLALVTFGLFMTASRTGAIMFLVSISTFFRYRGAKLLQTALILGLIAAIFLPSITPTDSDSAGILSNTLNKWNNLDNNTREDIWSGYWSLFLENPLFGAPFQGDRLRFGESSWLGVLGSMGIVGALPMFMFGWTSLQMIFNLERLAKRRPEYYQKCSTVMAGLLSLLVGGISEAYLLGNLTFSILAVLLYLVLGNYLLEVAQREAQLSLSN